MADTFWTVASLIAALQKYPSDTEVGIDGCGCCTSRSGGLELGERFERDGTKFIRVVIRDVEKRD